MEVRIKTFDVNMLVKKNGLELEVRTPDGSRQVGDCVVTMTGLTWCRGRTTQAKGTKMTWEELARILDSPEKKRAALAAADAL